MRRRNSLRVRVSAAEARRIALAAQGFNRARPECRPDARHFRRVINTLGLLQLDFVNVLMPAHYLVLWSRLGAYDKAHFDRFVYGCGEFTEQWAHEASIVPAGHWRLLAHRRAAYEPYKNSPITRLKNRERYLAKVLDLVTEQGPVTSQDLPPVPGPRRKPGDWHRSVPRWALEYHFGRGDLAVTRRLPNFQRVYDIAERVIPPDHQDCDLSREDANKILLELAAGALGIATRSDLLDYYRMSPREAAPLIDELVEDGTLHAVSVENWEDTAYLHPDARSPRVIAGASLLSPFDPVVWFRPRAERLFGFHYRIEIYVPEAKRKWGYYVLPFRLGDDIVARVDLKADRKAGILRVQSTHAEEGIDETETIDALASELSSLSDWLQLDSIAVRRHSDFSRRLGRCL